MNSARQTEIFWQIYDNQPISISDIAAKLKVIISIPTLNRELASLKSQGLIILEGSGRNIKYKINSNGLVAFPISLEEYYKTEYDQRKIISRFNFQIFEVLDRIQIFDDQETEKLNTLTAKYRTNIQNTTNTLIQKEFERLMIELSWKSSQIEGNTYDLLDTEQLLKYNILSQNNSKEEATMLLNHKAAIEYTKQYAFDFKEFNKRNLVEIQTLLTKDLGVTKNYRQRMVRITGTNYVPPENSFHIDEYVDKSAILINNKESIYEKALLSILLVSYLQPFEDGNKRTARLVGNSILMGYNCCPLSYRSISSLEYKKAMLLFYEVNNISAFKKIFIDQYEFAVNTYF